MQTVLAARAAPVAYSAFKKQISANAQRTQYLPTGFSVDMTQSGQTSEVYLCLPVHPWHTADRRDRSHA
jgi:siderophore synthetase component